MSDIIDINVIDSLKEIGDQEFLDELIDIFFSQSEELMRDINDFSAKKDADSLNKASHKLKGSCLNLGAKAMSATCQKIETSSRENDLSQIDFNVSELIKLHQETCNELRKLRQ